MSPDEDIKLIIANRIKPLPKNDYRIVKCLNFPKPRMPTNEELTARADNSYDAIYLHDFESRVNVVVEYCQHSSAYKGGITFAELTISLAHYVTTVIEWKMHDSIHMDIKEYELYNYLKYTYTPPEQNQSTGSLVDNFINQVT